MSATSSISVECPDCGRICGVVSNPAFVWVALKKHRCQSPQTTRTPSTTKREEPIMSLQSVPEARPTAASLVNHDDKRIARAAQKVLAAAAALDAAWEANAEKAALRAKRDRLKKQLAEVEAQIKGTTPVAVQAVDYKAVRAWAEANGYEVPKVGRIGQNIVAAYNQAGGAA